MARIAVGGFHHETNCFVLPCTDFAYFASHRDRPPLVRGADVLDWLRPSSFALGGALAALESRHEIVPLLWTSGGAGGVVTRDAFERIAAELIGRLSAALPVDAVYLDLHGAMVTEDFEDGEGELLRRLRAVVGQPIPVVISLDYHANVTPQMVETTDGLVGYLTYPHVDRRETGERAARIVEAVLQRGRPPGRALRKAPFLIPLNGQCTLVEPSRGVVARSSGTRGRPGQPVLPGWISAVRSVLVRSRGDCARLDAASRRSGRGRVDARDRIAGSQFCRAHGLR